MRIISGLRRGHKFDGPSDKVTRPTSDLVRESLFNILGDRVAGLPAVDLFAGTGALGLEALSRGASGVTFVERDRDNVGLIRRNIATLRFEGLGTVMATDAHRWVRGAGGRFDAPTVVFLDPPYREYENHPGRVTRMLQTLIEGLPDGSAIALEASKQVDASIFPDPDGWDIRRYGGTQIALRWIGAGAGEEIHAAVEDEDEESVDDDDHGPADLA